ncbi:ion transport peptide-like isoform X1 [Euwallacea fornicatus]|uniref:ion transport peptide-like isoform X1 n=1 Tax=Euwallacea fornicatus TaxID=995702 RepID=UPI00339008D8
MHKIARISLQKARIGCYRVRDFPPRAVNEQYVFTVNASCVHFGHNKVGKFPWRLQFSRYDAAGSSTLPRVHLEPAQQSSDMSQRSSHLDQRGRGTRRAAVWCLAIALVVQSARAGTPWRRGSGPLLTHHLSKRSFFDIQCKGVYDKTIFAKLDRICEDCYNLFREPQVHSLCMKNCFTTGYFKGCLETLQLTDEVEQVKDMIRKIHGAPPDE